MDVPEAVQDAFVAGVRDSLVAFGTKLAKGTRLRGQLAIPVTVMKSDDLEAPKVLFGIPHAKKPEGKRSPFARGCLLAFAVHVHYKG